MLKLRVSFVGVSIASCCLMVGTAARAQTVVIDQGLGTQISAIANPIDSGNPLPVLGGALLTVDGSGNRTLLSDFGDVSQGPIGGGQLKAIAWIPAGLLGLGHTILALDASAGTNRKGALFAVNTYTGNRTIFNDFGDPSQGSTGANPIGIVVSNGLLGLGTNIYVIDNSAGANGVGALFRIDPATGNRTLLSDFSNSNQGPLGLNPVSIAIAPAGLLGLGAELVVLDNDAGMNAVGEVFAIDSNGNRTLLSDLGNAAQGRPGIAPQNVAVVSGLLGLGTNIYVVDNQAGTNSNGMLFQIMVDGSRTVASDFGSSVQGITGDNPDGITSDVIGNLLITDSFPGSSPAQGKLFSVTLNSGQRTVLTDCGDIALGPCQQLIGVTQVPY